jgi:uncharacterized protein YndB with AHSA1/START domain
VTSNKTSSGIDFLRYIGMVTREVQLRDYEGRAAHVLAATCVYDTAIDDVWDAITNPERIPRWFLPISGDLRLGGRYQLEGNASGQIIACDPPRTLDLSWEFGGEISWVEVRLTQLSDGGTSLRLEHIAHVQEPDEGWNQYGPGAGGVGWDLAMMLGLTPYLKTGATMGHEEAEQWTLSDEGKDFIRRCSDDWCRASIASGTPEAAAREAAERTRAFYTGEAQPEGEQPHSTC